MGSGSIVVEFGFNDYDIVGGTVSDVIRSFGERKKGQCFDLLWKVRKNVCLPVH